LVLIRIVGVLAASVFCVSAALAKPAPDGFSELVEKLSPSVVNISTEKPLQNAQGRAPVPMPFALQKSAAASGSRSLGSGFVIDGSGLIVTNNHVIEGAREILVGFHDGTRRGAVVVGRDEKTDIALLPGRRPKPLRPRHSAIPMARGGRLGAGDRQSVRAWRQRFGGNYQCAQSAARCRDL
jgi:serine protease Do